MIGCWWNFVGLTQGGTGKFWRKSFSVQARNSVLFQLGNMAWWHDLGSCKLQISVIFFVSSDIKKQANWQLPLNVQKLEVFRLQGGFTPLASWPGLLSFAYCSINMVSFLYDIVYHFWYLCNRLLFR